jgi:hypothetical protein
MKKKKTFHTNHRSQYLSFAVNRSSCKIQYHPYFNRHMISIPFPKNKTNLNIILTQQEDLFTSGGLQSVFFLAISSQFVLNTVPPDSDYIRQYRYDKMIMKITYKTFVHCSFLLISSITINLLK